METKREWTTIREYEDILFEYDGDERCSLYLP